MFGRVKENLVLMVRWTGLIAEAEQNVGVLGISQDAVMVMPLLFGVRYYWSLAPSPFCPYVVASAGYHLIANFAEPIRGRKNFSGPELSISLSLLWGKDVGKVKGILR